MSKFGFYLLVSIYKFWHKIPLLFQHDADLWVLCSEIFSLDESEESFKKQWEYLLKAHTCAVFTRGWEMTLESCQRVVAILERLLTCKKHKLDSLSMF